MSPIRGTGVLAVWNDIADEHEAEYNDWYTNQHLPERVGIQGFLRGRRFRRVSDDPGQRYFTLYETESTATLTSAPYLERLNDPTEWTTRVTPLFLNGVRTACSVTRSLGRGTGGYGTTIEFGATAGREDQLRTWTTDDVLPKLVLGPDVVSAHLFEADPETTSAKDSTAEQAAMAGRPTVAVRWFVLVESASEEGAAAAREALSEQTLGAHGADRDVQVGTFRLLVSLTH